MKFSRYVLVLLPVLVLGLAAGVLWAQESGTVGPAGPKVNDDLYTAGDVVTVTEDVAGDLMVAGQRVDSLGRVEGDVLAAGRTVVIAGSVGGDIRAAGQNITLEGRVGRAATIFAQQLDVGSGADVGRNLLFGGESLLLGGAVHGNVRAWTSRVTVSGRIDGDLEITADNIEILPTARVGGDVVARGANPPRIAEEAEISGQVKYTPVSPAQPEAAPWWRVLLQRLLSLVKLLGLALVLALLTGPFLRAQVEALRDKPWASLGTGLGWLVLAPLAIVLLAVIVVGQSIAWVLGVGYAGSIALAVLLFKPVIGTWLGQWLLARFSGGRKYAALWGTLLGTVILWLVSLIPVAGGIVTVLGMILTLGAWLILVARYGLAWPQRGGTS